MCLSQSAYLHMYIESLMVRMYRLLLGMQDCYTPSNQNFRNFALFRFASTAASCLFLFLKHYVRYGIGQDQGLLVTTSIVIV